MPSIFQSHRRRTRQGSTIKPRPARPIRPMELLNAVCLAAGNTQPKSATAPRSRPMQEEPAHGVYYEAPLWSVRDLPGQPFVCELMVDDKAVRIGEVGFPHSPHH